MLPRWRNWNTRTLEVRVPKGLGVRIPPWAPMTFNLDNYHFNPNDLVRRIGYTPIARTERGELNCVRPMGGDYPRFHVYLLVNGTKLTVNLHLDQKKASYEGSHAHSGDYDSDIIKAEAQRISKIVLAGDD